MEFISDNVFVINSPSAHSAAIVQLTGWRDLAHGSSIITPAAQGSISGTHRRHVPWGPSDNFPNLMRQLSDSNNMLPSLFATIRDMIYGQRPGYVQVTIENNQEVIKPYYDQKLQEWEEETDLVNYEIEAINQLIDNANIFTRFELDVATGMPLISISDSYKTRIGFPSSLVNGIEEYHINPYFGDYSIFSHKDTSFVKKFNKKTFGLDLVQIHHAKIRIPGNPYYSYPTWWAAADWIELANLIPRFHISGIKNGYNIKYLIKIPKDYFDSTPGQPKISEAEQQQKWGAFESRIREMLSGENQVNKAMFVKYLRGVDGKMLDNIDVVPLKNEMSDDAYGKILEMANLGITNAASVIATLAGSNPGKGNDSGSQIRVMADYQSHFRTPIPRTIVSEGINKAIRLLDPKKYKNVIRAYPGVQLTTLDKNPSGVQKTGTAGPEETDQDPKEKTDPAEDPKP